MQTMINIKIAHVSHKYNYFEILLNIFDDNMDILLLVKSGNILSILKIEQIRHILIIIFNYIPTEYFATGTIRKKVPGRLKANNIG